LLQAKSRIGDHVVSTADPSLVVLFSLALGVGVYLGFTWSRNLDVQAGLNDNRNVLIIYIVSTVISLLVYSTSLLVSDSERRTERQILEHNFIAFVHKFSSNCRSVVCWKYPNWLRARLEQTPWPEVAITNRTPLRA
jgi:hypothetical protein